MHGMRRFAAPVMWYSDAAEALSQGALAVRVPAPGVSDMATEAMDLMQTMVAKFLDLPEDERNRYMIFRPPFLDGASCDDGIIHRLGPEDRNSIAKDHKIFFHYRSRFRRWARERGLGVEWFADLTRVVSLIHAETFKCVLTLARELEYLSGTHGLANLIRSQRQEYVLRLLQYQGIGEHGLLGNWHYDRSFLTAHVANSISGYVAEDPNNQERRLIEPEPGTLLFFFGKQAERVFSGDPQVRAIKHCATDLREPGDERLRNSIVGFVHAVSPAEALGISGQAAA